MPLATQRNRWRRRVKEILRKRGGKILPGYEAALKVNKAAPALKFSELEKQIVELLDSSGVMKE